MRNNYTNLPVQATKDSTIKSFEGYQNLPTAIDPTVLGAITGFFSSRGFGNVAAELLAETIAYQAKVDGYNAMQILDTMKGLTNVEISSIVAEILNYTRYKSSSLGYATKTMVHPEIERNLLV